MAASLAQRIAARLGSLPSHDAATLHRLRRELSKEVAGEEPEIIIQTAMRLLELREVPGVKMIAFALVGNHAAALRELDGPKLERLGKDLASWGDVDMFGCLVAGPAWRAGSIGDGVIRSWASSSDRWWRRAALVSTVPLNVRSQGGSGDTRRTLAICRLLVRDRDDMVVKGLSWALRELAVRDPEAVQDFVSKQAHLLAPRVNARGEQQAHDRLEEPA
jgi:DNA alkylation repair enzyme